MTPAELLAALAAVEPAVMDLLMKAEPVLAADARAAWETVMALVTKHAVPLETEVADIDAAADTALAAKFGKVP